MALAENLEPKDVADLRDTFESKIQDRNPMATFKSGPSESIMRLAEHEKLAERIVALESKIDKVINLFSQTFGNAVLINGRWVTLSHNNGEIKKVG